MKTIPALLNFLWVVLIAGGLNSSPVYGQAELWGMTSNGGPQDYGTIFKTDGNGNNQTVVHTFEKSDGTYPYYLKLCQATDGKLYGMTYGGGASDKGVIFSFDPATGTYLKKFDFDGPINGSIPRGNLIQASNGKLYGMTYAGGTSDFGVIFEYDPVSGSFTKLLDFNGTNGKTPLGSLIQLANGKLYGMTSLGGVYGYGVLFEFDPVSNGITIKVSLNTAANGRLPYGSLLQASNIKLYGMTNMGGANNVGVIFEYDPATNIYTKKIDLSVTNGYTPYGSLIQASNGKLYGMTFMGGGYGHGVLFEYNYTTNSYSRKVDFYGTSMGRGPYGDLLQISNGKMFGMAYRGGANNVGVIFEYDPATNIYTKKLDFNGANNGSEPRGTFIVGNNGKLYGGTTLGGANSFGVLFEYDPVTYTYRKMLDFGNPGNGSAPYGSLMKATDGKLYGTTSQGGINGSGVLFRCDTSGSYQKLFDFDGTANGSNPRGSLVQADNGKLYGMTQQGGLTNEGVIFEYDPVALSFTKMIDLSWSALGANPSGSFIKAGNGKLYGMTYQGGVGAGLGYGVILEYDPVINICTKKIDFGWSNGAFPMGDLLLAPDGKMYGVTAAGSSGNGILFEYDPATNILVKKIDFDNSGHGGHPYGNLIRAGNGKFYGMTTTGGAYGYGILFEYDPLSNSLINKLDFDGSNYGRSPNGSLVQAANGNLYGMTYAGGANDLGVLFEYNPATGVSTKKFDFTGTNGKYPQYTQLLSIETEIACDPPSLLIAMNITSDSAILSWESPGSATSWNIEYGLHDFIPGNGITITGISDTLNSLSDLEPSTAYDFYVQSVCGQNTVSSWAGPVTFTTIEGVPCFNPANGGAIASSQTICFGTIPNPFTSVNPASGQTGILEYKWQSSADNIVFNDIPGSNTESFSYGNTLTAITWFKRLARVNCQPDWTGAASSNTIQISIEGRDRYRTKTSGDWDNIATWEYFNGSTWVDAVDYPSAASIVCPNPLAVVRDGHTISVDAAVDFGNVTVDAGGILEVQNDVAFGIITGDTLTVNGTLIMHTTAVVNGAGHFRIVAGGTIHVGSTAGITVSNNTGNIQVTGSRTYFSGAHYVFTGTSNQFTGDALVQNTPGNISINAPGMVVTLSQAISISGNIHIIAGTLDVNNHNLTLGGNWTNDDIFIPGTGTVYFTSNVNVFISVSNFYHVVFAGSGTVTALGSLTVYGDLTITYQFDAGTFTHYVYGNWINNGVFIYGTSTIQFMGTATYYISISNFYNIIFAGTGTYTATGSLSIYGNITINNYFDAGAFTHYVYGNWINNGTFVQGTSTIQFSGTGNITIGASNFYNVVYACSGTVIASGQLTFYGNVTINNYFDAGSYVHYVYGNWTNNGTFVYGTSTVNFVGTGTVYVGTSTFYNIIFSGTGTYYASGSISIYGDITIMTNFYAGTYTISVYGNWVNNGIFDYGSSTVEFIGSGNITITQNDFYNVIFGGSGIFIATGSLNFYGNVTINSTFDAGSYEHYIYGNWTNNGTFIYGTSTIYFVGTVNIYIGASSFNNVVFGGTGSVFATGSLTIYGDVTINNYFDAGSFSHYIYGNWFNNGIFVYGTSTIYFVGSGNLFISVNEFYNVIFDGTATYTATGSITFWGSVTINNYFDAGAFIHYVYGNWTVYGTFVYGTSTIQFMGAGNIYIGISNFYNIIFAGSGTVTATGSLTFYGDVTINNYFNAGSFAHYVYGNWINNGTFVYGTSTIYFSATVNIYINTNEFYNVVFGGTGNYVATGSITFYGSVTINNYFDAGAFTHYVYGSWTVNGVFVYGTSTIHFMGTGISLVNAGNFYHVIFGGSGTVTANGSLTIYGNVNITGNFGGGSYIHYIYGNWTNTGNFVYGTSTIHFIGTGNIVIGESDFYHIVFAGTGTIVASGSLAVYGDFTINTYFDAGSYEHYIYGNWYNYGTFVYGTSTIHFVGTGNIFLNPEEFYSVVFGGTGTVTATGSLIFHGNVTINNYFHGGAFVHYVYGNWTNAGTFVHGTSSIYFLGSGNILIGATNFYHVIFAGTGTIVATGSLTIYGDITISNQFDAASYDHYIDGNWINSGIFVYGTSTIHFVGSGNLYLGVNSFYNVVFAGTGTVTATGSLTIYGSVTITNHFDAGTYIHYVYGNWTNNGTFVHNTSTIHFLGTGNILVGPGNFYHVIFASTGTVVATGTLYIYGNVTINYHFDAGTFDHYVYGNWINNGTFVHGSSRIRFVGSQNLLIGTNNFYHVVFARTGTVTATGSLTIYGDITVTNHFDAGSYEHYIYGNWINNGTFVYSTSIIVFMGTVQQTIGGSYETGYYRFRVNNLYGILLNRNVTVHNELVLTEGIITTGTYVFIVMPGGTITGESAIAYIHGRLRCGYNVIGSRTFPVGTATTYGPMVFNYVTLTGTSLVDVEFIEGIIPGTIPGSITTVANHYWIISQTGGVSFTFTVTLNVTGFNPSGSVFILRGEGVNLNTYATKMPNYTNVDVFDTFGDFTLGEAYCAVPSGLINRYVTLNSTILDWETGNTEQEWNVEYGPAGFTHGTGTLLTNVTARPLQISGLTAHSYYEFYVQSVCTGEVQSPWTGPEPFSTFPKQLDATIFLEGPYNESSDLMETSLADNDLLPLSQPYSISPWNYNGDEQVVSIPPDVVDWVLIEWRDANAPGSANSASYIWRKAAFLKNDGSIVDLDGIGSPWIGNPQLHGLLYVVVYHRNHLAVLSNQGATLAGDVYDYDFSDALSKAYGGITGYQQIGTSPVRFGMVAGDGNADGQISAAQDVNTTWNTDAAKRGYFAGDYDMNSQVQNQDKNDKVVPNIDMQSTLP